MVEIQYSTVLSQHLYTIGRCLILIFTHDWQKTSAWAKLHVRDGGEGFEWRVWISDSCLIPYDVLLRASLLPLLLCDHKLTSPCCFVSWFGDSQVWLFWLLTGELLLATGMKERSITNYIRSQVHFYLIGSRHFQIRTVSYNIITLKENTESCVM